MLQISVPKLHLSYRQLFSSLLRSAHIFLGVFREVFVILCGFTTAVPHYINKV
jgi:hypothetical protein